MAGVAKRASPHSGFMPGWPRDLWSSRVLPSRQLAGESKGSNKGLMWFFSFFPKTALKEDPAN